MSNDPESGRCSACGAQLPGGHDSDLCVDCITASEGRRIRPVALTLPGAFLD